VGAGVGGQGGLSGSEGGEGAAPHPLSYAFPLPTANVVPFKIPQSLYDPQAAPAVGIPVGLPVAAVVGGAPLVSLSEDLSDNNNSGENPNAAAAGNDDYFGQLGKFYSAHSLTVDRDAPSPLTSPRRVHKSSSSSLAGKKKIFVIATDDNNIVDAANIFVVDNDNGSFRSPGAF